MSLPEHFTAKTMTSTCTVWTGSVNTLGYGIVQIDGRLQLAHRIAYEAERGPIPEGKVIDHLCRVRNCVKVEHLEAVTHKENVRRGRLASSLQVGDTCINGHTATSEADIYERPSGLRECRACKTAGRKGKRPTVRRSSERVQADVRKADAA